MFNGLEQTILAWAEVIPLWLFSLIAPFVEELIPPIPSPSIMLITGLLASVREYTLFGLLVLSLISAVGKTSGALVIYFIVDRVEDILTGRFGKFIGISHTQIESFGARLGRGWKDYLVLIVLRATPVVPSVFVSVGSGILKIPLKLFLISTLIGSIFRSFIYIYLGYIGADVASSFLNKTQSVESTISLLIVITIVIVLAYLYSKRRKMLK